jgi:hypothetical protein
VTLPAKWPGQRWGEEEDHLRAIDYRQSTGQGVLHPGENELGRNSDFSRLTGWKTS